MFRTLSLRRALAATAVLAGAAALFVVATPAGAYGGESGELLVHGIGSTYAGGHQPIVTQTTTAGSAVSYAVEVKNTGTAPAQFNLSRNNLAYNCAPGCPQPAVDVKSGSTDVTALFNTANGYFTPLIAAGKTSAFTIKVTIPKGTPASGVVILYLQLEDSAHTIISYAGLYSNVTQTKGTTTNEEFVSGASGQKAIGKLPGGFTSFLANPAVKLGGTSVFTVKLQNDSTSSAQIRYLLSDGSHCASYFPATVKAGSTDVTSLALAGTYVTPVLAPGKETTLTVTVTYASTPLGCSNADGTTGDEWVSQTEGTGAQSITLVTNSIAS